MTIIPEYLWELMLDAFSTVDAPVERVAYFDGVEREAVGVATTVTVPDARLFPKYFEVSAEAMSEAGKHLRQFRMVRLAQVHTHPGGWLDHSEWDDLRAYSQILGALSIVLPYHARLRPALGDAAVHLREADGWRRLEAEEVPGLVRIVPAYLDFRRLA